MKRIIKIVLFFLFIIIIVCGYSFLTDKNIPKNWDVVKLNSDSSEILWTKFTWGNDSISGRYFQKSSMFIPCQIKGLPYTFKFQFDLGAFHTGLYQNSLKSLDPNIKTRIHRLRSPLQFWNNKKVFSDLEFTFGNYKAINKLSYIYEGIGQEIVVNNSLLNDTVKIGTVGVDLFKNKVLIIDYPNEQFAICDEVPAKYSASFSNIEFDQIGRVLLPMKLKAKNYNIMFDNGSSIFPLLVSDNNINKFSTSKNIDTLTIYSWSKYHNVISKFISDSFELAGLRYSNIKVYMDFRKEYRTKTNDGLTGNILFWDKTIIIDFKNKKFGVL